MDAPAHALSRRPLALPAVRLEPLGPWLCAFVVVVYFGLKGGGYDQLIQGEIGVVAWWAVLVGALAGVLPLASFGRRGWIGVGLLAVYLVWMLIAVGWSQSEEQGWANVAHTATMLGLFALALAIQGRHASRHFVNGMAAGIVVIAAVALLSRLHPAFFDSNTVAEFLTNTRSRLSYPLNYWNALAALMALGLPLLWHAASSARTVVMQALAAGALPVLALTLYFTLSRGGVLAAVVGLAVFLLLAPDVLARLATLVIAGAGSAIVIAGAVQREALADGLGTHAAHTQGDELFAMVLVVSVGVAMLQAAVALAFAAAKRNRPAFPPARRALVLGLVVVVGVAAAIGARHDLSNRWDKFKNPVVTSTKHENRTAARFQSSSGNGRYQYWSAAVKAGRHEPLKGVGAGSWEYYWKQHATLGGQVRHAHSQFLQTFAELGLPGLLALAGFFGLTLVAGVLRALRGPRRGLAAAATAGVAAFTASALVDWSWEVTVVPVAFLGLAAVILAPAGARDRRRIVAGGILSRLPARIAVAVAAGLAIVVIALPLAEASYLRDSRDHYRAGDLAAAWRDARHAQDIQPFAAGPRLQEGLTLERAGALGPAAAAVRAAVDKEPTNAGAWIVLSRIEAERGQAAQAVAAYRKARGLDRTSSIFRTVAQR